MSEADRLTATSISKPERAPFGHLPDRLADDPAREAAGVAGLLRERHELRGGDLLRAAHASSGRALRGSSVCVSPSRPWAGRRACSPTFCSSARRSSVTSIEAPAVLLVAAGAIDAQPECAHPAHRAAPSARSAAARARSAHAPDTREMPAIGCSSRPAPATMKLAAMIPVSCSAMQRRALQRAGRGHDEELLGGKARDEIVRRDILPQAPRRLAQCLVADMMTE